MNQEQKNTPTVYCRVCLLMLRHTHKHGIQHDHTLYRHHQRCKRPPVCFYSFRDRISLPRSHLAASLGCHQPEGGRIELGHDILTDAIKLRKHGVNLKNKTKNILCVSAVHTCIKLATRGTSVCLCTSVGTFGSRMVCGMCWGRRHALRCCVSSTF